MIRLKLLLNITINSIHTKMTILHIELKIGLLVIIGGKLKDLNVIIIIFTTMVPSSSNVLKRSTGITVPVEFSYQSVPKDKVPAPGIVGSTSTIGVVINRSSRRSAVLPVSKLNSGKTGLSVMSLGARLVPNVVDSWL